MLGLWSSVKGATLLDKMDVMEKVYSNDQYREIFLEFAKAKYAEENVLFLCDIVKFRDADVSDRAALYLKLLAEYLDSSSEREVNLSFKAKKSLLNVTAFEDLSFVDLAWKEVEHQVVQNLCGPFLDLLPSKEEALPVATSTVEIIGPLLSDDEVCVKEDLLFLDDAILKPLGCQEPSPQSSLSPDMSQQGKRKMKIKLRPSGGGAK